MTAASRDNALRAEIARHLAHSGGLLVKAARLALRLEAATPEERRELFLFLNGYSFDLLDAFFDVRGGAR
jgi:hypothetical protein